MLFFHGPSLKIFSLDSTVTACTIYFDSAGIFGSPSCHGASEVEPVPSQASAPEIDEVGE